MELMIQNVSKHYGRKKALDDLSLELTTGVYGILGSNGSGKTTLMRILASIMKPSSGNIYFNGEDIVDMGDRYRSVIGYLPQDVGLYKNFTAEKFIQYIATVKGLSNEEARKKTDEVLKLVGLEEDRKGKVGKFSGGMVRRIGIAQALLNDPKILIVDEPTAGLDPKERIRFRNLMSKISVDRMVLLSTHIVSDIESIAKEILVLKYGDLIHKAPPQALLKAIEGQVWSVVVKSDEVDDMQASHRVGNITRVDDQFKLRIISDGKPHRHANPEVPNLEDLYLYYFVEEGVM